MAVVRASDASSVVARRLLTAAGCGAIAVAAGYVATTGPQLAVGVVAMVSGILLARVSPAIPLGCAGLPTLVIAVLGRNPLPSAGVRVLMLGWIGASVLFAVSRRPLDRSAYVNAPVVLSLAFGGLLIAGATRSSVPAYGWFKAEDFIAINVALMAGALFVARNPRDFHLYVVLTWVVAIMASFLLLRGHVNTTVGGRYSLTAQEHPIELGRSAAAGIMAAVYLFFTGRNGRVRALSLASLPLIAISLFAAGSRGPLLALAVTLVLFVLLVARTKRSHKHLLFVALAATAAFAIVPRYVPSYNIGRALESLTGGGSGDSSNGRIAFWVEAWRAFEHHPILGLGTGGFAAIERIELYPHNIFLEVAAELGLVGLLVLLVVLGAGFLRAARNVARADERNRPRAALVGALLLMAVINACLSGDLPANGSVWLALGLASGLRMTFTAHEH